MSKSNGKTKTIVITGVSRGLGQAMVGWFIDQGHTVHGCARGREAIEELRKSYPAPHRFAVVDVTDAGAVQRWAEEVIEQDGAPDLLLNNAALINRNAPLVEVPVEEFSTVMDVNIKGVFHVCKAFLPAMIAKRHGVVVNFSSGWGRSVSAEVGPYCTTKWAVEGLTRALAEELPEGMAAVPLNPGMIDTPMLRSCFGTGASSTPDPKAWVRRAGPFLLGLGPSDNGKPLSVSF